MIRVFPRRTKWTPIDKLAFVGDPPLFRPEDQPVKISVAFTWDRKEGERLYRSWKSCYSDVELGGPAFNYPAGEFIPGRFIKEGVTFTSRGCVRRCPFCLVPDREGRIMQFSDNDLSIHDGHIVQDNNLLACSPSHIKLVFDMLKRQKKAAIFSGGLDARLFQPWHKALIDSIRVDELWFACDSVHGLGALNRVSELLKFYPRQKLRCFVLAGFWDWDTPEKADERCRTIYKMGFDPFTQLYRGLEPKEYSEEWKRFQRTWSRPAAYRTLMEGGK